MPRSGSTWLASVLAAGEGVAVVHEPDNPWTKAYALRAKMRLPGRIFPVLAAGAEAPMLAHLWRRAAGEEHASRAGPLAAVSSGVADRLWKRLSHSTRRAWLRPDGPPTSVQAVAGLARAPRPGPVAEHVVLRSVYACLCLDWVAMVTGSQPVVVLRHPLNVISSWIALGWLQPDEPGTQIRDMLAQIDAPTVARLGDEMGAAPPPSSASQLRRGAYLFGLLHAGLARSAARNPEWPVVWHEDLCAAPEERMSRLAGGLGLPWDESNVRTLTGLDRPGEGDTLDRRTRSQPGVWRERLTEGQAGEVERVLEEMGLGEVVAERPGLREGLAPEARGSTGRSP